MHEKPFASAAEFEPPKYLISLIGAVNDGAKAAQGGGLAFLLVGIYLLATAFSASDEDLQLGKTVTISQIGASLPVSFSFAIAPLVFVFLHIYTLVRYDMLAANVRRLVCELQDSVRMESDRDRCRQLLANIEFVAAATIPRRSTMYSGVWRWLFIGIVVLFPVMMLLLVQINALRYQSETIVWFQRAWLALDLAVLAWFFARGPFYAGEIKNVTASSRPMVRRGILLGLPILVLSLNLAWLGTASPATNPELVRYDPRSSYWGSHPRPSFVDVLLQPLDMLVCPGLDWGCRFLRVDHQTLVGKVWDDKAVAQLRNGTPDFCAFDFAFSPRLDQAADVSATWSAGRRFEISSLLLAALFALPIFAHVASVAETWKGMIKPHSSFAAKLADVSGPLVAQLGFQL